VPTVACRSGRSERTQPQSWPGPPNPRLPRDRVNAVPTRLASARETRRPPDAASRNPTTSGRIGDQDHILASAATADTGSEWGDSPHVGVVLPLSTWISSQ
jgi:hypothetical protein